MNITLCIPRLENTIELNYVKSIFARMNVGEIKGIFEIPLRAEVKFKRVMIQMNIDENKEVGDFIMKRMNSGKDVKVVYNSPCYWKVYRRRINKAVE